MRFVRVIRLENHTFIDRRFSTFLKFLNAKDFSASYYREKYERNNQRVARNKENI